MRRKSFKGIAAGMLAMSLVATAPTITFAKQQADGAPKVTAATTADKKTETKKPDTKKPESKAQKAEKVTCTSAGKVNISFKGNVTYTDALKAVIQDENGQEIACKISKKNKSMLTVSVSGLVKGQKYTIIIEGVKGKDAAEAVTITKTFIAKGMKTQSKVSKTTVQDKKFVVLKMQGAVDYKNTTITVTDSDGNVCEAKIVKKSKGSIKIQITGMQKGKSYTITVNGVKTKKEQNYGSITKTITVK